ncbi:MAG: hypothetical protein JXB47_06800 [Anaerolineae bacterium]|nr:hypothetical protein [Anaerolineae bacterium]
MLFDKHQEDIINRMLDGEATPEEAAMLGTILAAPADRALWEAMQDVDRLLRTAPTASPPPGFTARVMAQIYAGAPVQAKAASTPNGMTLAGRLALVALAGVGVLLLVRLAVGQLIGPLPSLEELSMTVSYIVNGFIDVIEWLFDYVGRYPALPAIGLASIPLAFAVTWLVVYYTPKEPFRRAAHLLIP